MNRDAFFDAFAAWQASDRTHGNNLWMLHCCDEAEAENEDLALTIMTIRAAVFQAAELKKGMI